MDSSSDAHSRNKCAACYRQFNRMEHLVEHMRVSHHSAHEPRCSVCSKHCRSLEALRDHLGGSLPKPDCARAFAALGCQLCLAVFPSAAALRAHRAACQLSRAPPQLQGITRSLSRMSVQQQQGGGGGHGGGVVALGCKMVGGGSDGTLDVCARVCVVDEQESIIYDVFVKPQIPVTHYRYETTGIRPEHLRNAEAVTVKQAQRLVQEILLNGEQPWKVRTSRGAARILIGHGLDHDLDALGMDYPAYLKRDTATYPPLMKTSGRLSNTLRYLTQACLGYDIQTGHQHPYDDCVAAMRLYKRMRALPHPKQQQRGDAGDGAGCTKPAAPAAAFPAWRQRELERMSPEELLRMSRPDYHCWCLDD